MSPKRSRFRYPALDLEARRQFPRRMKVGLRAVAWVEREAYVWLARGSDSSRTSLFALRRMQNIGLPANRGDLWRYLHEPQPRKARNDRPFRILGLQPGEPALYLSNN
ncbi:MAG: AlpA family phage regulatory protein [Steroidobacteraceae bacterium]